MIRRTMRRVVDRARARGLTDVDIVLHPTDRGDGEPSVSGMTSGAHSVHIGIERAWLETGDVEGDLIRVATHELHHARRWPFLASRWTVAEIVALEGLAILADHAAAGPQDDFDRPMADPAAALRQLEAIADQPLQPNRPWLYSPETIQPGGVARVYSLGILVMGAALEAGGLDPWSAVDRPAADLVAAGLMRLRLARPVSAPALAIASA